MPYSRHVGYLCPGITLFRRVITGRHAAPFYSLSSTLAPRVYVYTHSYKYTHTNTNVHTHTHTHRPLSRVAYRELFVWIYLQNVGEPILMYLCPYPNERNYLHRFRIRRIHVADPTNYHFCTVTARKIYVYYIARVSPSALYLKIPFET